MKDASRRRQAQQRAEALVDLWRRVHDDPRGHDFFALLRRVDALHPEWPRLGLAPRPSQEALRLGQEPALAFAPAALSRLAPADTEAGGLPRLHVHLFGLLGPQGPMPLHLTEYTRSRLRHNDDPALSRFLDIFHHRLLSLFFRAWAHNQPTVQHDRPQDDRYAAWLGACAGLASARTHSNDGRIDLVPPQAALSQAGLLAQRSRHPEGLAKLLATHFGVPVRIEQHVAQWLEIDPEDRTPLGRVAERAARVQGGVGQLGTAATAGRRRLDRQFKFRIVFGPLARREHDALLPGGMAWLTLRQWVRHYTGLDLRWDVQLVLRACDKPQAALAQRPCLGVSTWIGRSPPDRDGHELRLRSDTCFLQRRYAIAQSLPPRINRAARHGSSLGADASAVTQNAETP